LNKSQNIGIKRFVHLGDAKQDQLGDKEKNIQVDAENNMADIIKLLSPYVDYFKDQCKKRKRDPEHLRQAMRPCLNYRIENFDLVVMVFFI
jgi:hypothetical protein